MDKDHWLKIGCYLDGKGGCDRFGADHVLQADRTYWVHLDYTQPQSAQWMRDNVVPERVIEALTATETRPRASEVSGGLLVYLRGVNLQPGARPEDMIALRLWLGPNGVISTQKRTLVSVETEEAQLEAGEGPTTATALVAGLVDELTWRMEDVIENLETEVEHCAEQLDASPTASLTSQLGLLRRRAITLRRYLTPQREALMKLQSDRLFGELDVIQIREATDRLLRLVEDLDAAREHATLLQEEVFAVQNEAINDRMYLLAIISALFLPLGFLTGLFGINVGGLPGVENEQAFWWFCGVMTLIAIGVMIWMRKRRWF
ncbi:zinc transporter ZntB [Alcanivorax sp. S6407]|uniref:zinc transporter ZntB n=1 Tax=Alcanivorax sp. S6407 TaxID=2926424 RepID=UPI001FF3CDB6|nr:zinc transporter ZntB [Alcanivorax sp. S6407]MCK0152607.1 zinc transporter ZntB [Alcanivorax sp. S6407]